MGACQPTGMLTLHPVKWGTEWGSGRNKGQGHAEKQDRIPKEATPAQTSH